MSAWQHLDHDDKFAFIRSGRLRGKSIKDMAQELGTTPGAVSGFFSYWLGDDPELIRAGEENERRFGRVTEQDECRRWTRKQVIRMNNRALARLAAVHRDRCPHELKRAIAATAVQVEPSRRRAWA